MSSVWNSLTGYFTCKDNQSDSIERCSSSPTRLGYIPPVVASKANTINPSEDKAYLHEILNPPPPVDYKCEVKPSTELKLTHTPPRPLYKILIIGKRGVGKSKLFNSYRGQT